MVKFKIGDKVRMTDHVKNEYHFYDDALMTIIGFVHRGGDDDTSKDEILPMGELIMDFSQMSLDDILVNYLVVVDGYDNTDSLITLDGKLYDMGYHTFYPLFLEKDKYTLRKEKLEELLDNI